MSPSSLNRPSGILNCLFHVICWRASQKNTVHGVLDFLKKFLESILPKITQKTENDTVWRYQFGSNLDSKFCVRKQIFWAMGESGRSFRLEFMKKSKFEKKLLKIKKKRILLNMMVPNFLYTNSMLLFVTRTIRTQLSWTVRK